MYQVFGFHSFLNKKDCSFERLRKDQRLMLAEMNEVKRLWSLFAVIIIVEIK